MYKCLTCGKEKETQRDINGHVIRQHLPYEWTQEDLERTSEKVEQPVK